MQSVTFRSPAKRKITSFSLNFRKDSKYGMLSPINANTTEVSSIINESIARKDEDDTLESLLNDKDTSEGIAETDEVVK